MRAARRTRLRTSGQGRASYGGLLSGRPPSPKENGGVDRHTFIREMEHLFFGFDAK